MFSYFIILFVVYGLLIFSQITRKYGFKNLSIKREAEKNVINEGEEFKISIIIENKKYLPISFLILRELIPKGLEFHGDDIYLDDVEFNYHTSKYSIKWYERVKRTYRYKGLKRGTYLLKEINVDLGDIFGFYTDESQIEDYLELLVYPKFIDLKALEINSTSLYGESIIKRWIYKDPLFVKGVREYGYEDKMSDIHWKSSLKMNKLMVKEYDYTAEPELVVILDVQCSDPYWRDINKEAVEKGIRVSVSLIKEAVKEGIAAGLWTDANIISYKDNIGSEVSPSLKSLNKIMELCARVDYSPRSSLEEYIAKRLKYFKTNSSYIFVTSYLNERSLNLIAKLKRNGYSIKIMDVSEEGTVPSIANIEKVTYKGGAL